MLRRNGSLGPRCTVGLRPLPYPNPEAWRDVYRADLELMRPSDALPYSIATLICCAANILAHHLPIGGGRVLPTTKATMKVGQRVRFKSTSAARYWKIPQDAQGTVMCSYRLLTSNRARADRLDVRITPQLVIWGGAAEDFEEIRDVPERPTQ
jgi:hypothetical protein